MRNRYLFMLCWLLLSSFFTFLLFLPSLPGQILYAQAGCPSVTQNGWRKCARVYYRLTGFNSTQSSQILAAISAWNTANQTNNSRVTFIQGTQPTGLLNTGSLDIRAGSTTNGSPAETIKNIGIGAINNATIIINLQATIPNTFPPRRVFESSASGYNTIFRKVALHEIGHTLGIGHPPIGSGSCFGQVIRASVMNSICGQNDIDNNMPTNITTCDTNAINSETTLYPTGNCPRYRCDGTICVEDPNGEHDDPGCYFECNTDPIPPSCERICSGSIESGCNTPSDPCLYPPNGCIEPYFPDISNPNCCCFATPILIDVSGNGYNLTDNFNGVNFDLNNDGEKERLSWTSRNSDDAFLALDRNGNGIIDGGREVFGNTTPQPLTPVPNGFIALSEYDKPRNGGNNNGRIDTQDVIFASLKLWQDVNHNGISEPGELSSLISKGIYAIALDYQTFSRFDEHGNWFRFRARVFDVRGASVGRWAWDIFLVRQ